VPSSNVNQPFLVTSLVDSNLIPTGFKVLSEAERTAALYSLLQHSTQVQIRFFITVLQQMARADPMTALLSPAVGGSMQSQMEAKLASMSLKSPGLKSNMPSSPSTRNFSNTANPNRQSLAFDTTSSFLSPDTANGLTNPNDAAATLAQQRAKLKASNAAHRISAPALASSAGERGTWAAAASSLGQLAERDNSPTQEISIEPKSSRPQSTDFSGIAASATFRSPRPDGSSGGNSLDSLSPAVGDSWASMVNTPLMPMFQKPSTTNNAGAGPTQTVDLATAKLNDLYGAGSVPRLDGPEKFRRASKSHALDSGSNTTNTAVPPNNGIYGDDGDLIQGQAQQGPGGRTQGGSTRSLRNGGTWSGAQSPALSNTSGRFGGSDDGSSAMAAAAQQQAALAGLGMGVGGFNLGLASPALAGMPNGLNMAQLAQLNGINPFGVNMNMLNMANAMGISAEAQLLAAQIAAAGGGFGQPGLGIGAGLGTFGGLQNGGGGQRGGPGRSGGRSPGVGSNKGTSSNGAKKDEDDFDPVVLNDVAGWLRSLRLHKYTPNFEGMTWKDMIVMDEAALEAQGVAALGARRKMLKTFEVVRKKMGIDDPTALPPPGAPVSAVSASPTSTGATGMSTGSSGA
jgi:SAM domain (Sterile alpha motif)